MGEQGAFSDVMNATKRSAKADSKRMHALFGLRDQRYPVRERFTVGKGLRDGRIAKQRPYPALCHLSPPRPDGLKLTVFVGFVTRKRPDHSPSSPEKTAS